MVVVRHLVLDNEAAFSLLSTRRSDAKRAKVVEAIAAANGQRSVPTAVRVEAGWDRTAPRAANANRLLGAGADRVLDSEAADRAVQLRRLVLSASVVDATVVVAAETLGKAGGVVEILTSDVPDVRALAAHVTAAVVVTLLS